MSHASATRVARPARPARTTEAAPARPLLVVERLDHTVGSTVLFTLCAGPTPAPAGSAVLFTLCAGPTPANPAPHRAQTMASVAVEGDAGAWV